MVSRRSFLSLPTALLTVLLAACQKELVYEDYGEVKEVKLSYTEPSTLQYHQDIDSIRWLLFDGEGRFYQELHMDHCQRQYFDRSDLPDGDYTVVCLANATDRSFLDNSALTLDSLTLWADTRRDDGSYDNIDCLFWTMQRFRMGDGIHVVECPMVDIHCHLHVRLWWRGVPTRTDGAYTLRLFDVPLSCKAGTMAYNIGGLPHPDLGETLGEHRIAVEPYNFIISGEFVTMRWTDDYMPSLQLWCGDEPATPLIDLYQVFSEWHWSPDHTIAQDYWLNIEVGLDGSVEVSVGGKGRIVDWQDGGVIGGNV